MTEIILPRRISFGEDLPILYHFYSEMELAILNICFQTMAYAGVILGRSGLWKNWGWGGLSPHKLITFDPFVNDIMIIPVNFLEFLSDWLFWECTTPLCLDKYKIVFFMLAFHTPLTTYDVRWWGAMGSTLFWNLSTGCFKKYKKHP